jgi:SAM-dependent methyltransferase
MVEAAWDDREKATTSGPGEPRFGSVLPDLVEGDSMLQSSVLEELSSAVSYRRWLSSLALPVLRSGRVLEIGSGTGDYAAEWADLGVAITASEADEYRLGQLRRRFRDDPRVEVLPLAVPIGIDADYDALVMYNVLEHIPDDASALGDLCRLVRPGGRIVVLVPAFELAMSQFDLAIGHQRRYRRSTLRSALEQGGWQVERIRYVNPVGLVAWLVLMRLLRQRPSDGPLLRLWDRAVVPVLRGLDRWFPAPFGQSVLAVGRRR